MVERLARILCVLLVAVAGWRALEGFGTTTALRKAKQSAYDAEYVDARRFAERAERGVHAYEAAWLQGEVRVGTWDWTEEDFAGAERHLDEADIAFVRAATEAPASPWPWIGLAEAYRRRETHRERSAGFDLGLLRLKGWDRVGREGRVAIGAATLATELAPHRYETWDRLIRLYLFLELREEARRAARHAATVQPAFRFYRFFDDPRVDADVLDAFEEGSIESLGEIPMMRREAHLLSLARLAQRRGRFEESLRYLEEAESLTRLDRTRAQVRFWMGIAFKKLDRAEEARTSFLAALEHPHFERNAESNLAALDRTEGRFEDAMKRYAALRRREPRNLHWSKSYSEVARSAGRLDAAREALLWSKQIAHLDPVPRLQLVEVLYEMGDVAGARRELQDLRRLRLVDAARLDALDRALSEVRGGL